MPSGAGETSAIESINFNIDADAAALRSWERLDQLRDRAPLYWNEYGEDGFWMVLTYDLIREIYQHPEVFSSDALIVTEPNPVHQFIPTMVNPPQHAKYRQLLNTMFSPAVVQKLEPLARERVNALIDTFIDKGECDAMKDFAIQFPSEMFLGIIGLPLEDADKCLEWAERLFDNVFADDRNPLRDTLNSIDEYFADILKKHRAGGAGAADGRRDLVGHLAASTIDGRPLEDAEILNICSALLLAGLDTVKSQLGYSLRHFATHPDDRRRLIADPELAYTAVEEMLRSYGIVTNFGRKVTRDVEFHGCPMKKDDMVMLATGSADRDPSAFERSNEVLIDRSPNRHLAFGGGPHRCIGSHLARMELRVALQEWHKRIPEYGISPKDLGVERGGMVELTGLCLEWPREPKTGAAR